MTNNELNQQTAANWVEIANSKGSSLIMAVHYRSADDKHVSLHLLAHESLERQNVINILKHILADLEQGNVSKRDITVQNAHNLINTPQIGEA